MPAASFPESGPSPGKLATCGGCFPTNQIHGTSRSSCPGLPRKSRGRGQPFLTTKPSRLPCALCPRTSWLVSIRSSNKQERPQSLRARQTPRTDHQCLLAHQVARRHRSWHLPFKDSASAPVSKLPLPKTASCKTSGFSKLCSLTC